MEDKRKKPLSYRTYADHVKAFCRSAGVTELSNYASRRQRAPTGEKKEKSANTDVQSVCGFVKPGRNGARTLKRKIKTQ